MSILGKVTRKLAKQRTVSFYQDQEDRVKELEEKGYNIQFADLARVGADLALAQIERELESKGTEEAPEGE